MLVCLCVLLLSMAGGSVANTVQAINATCSADTLTVQLRMERPFQGMVYARGFPLECRALGTGSSWVTLHLPAARCGVRLEDGQRLMVVVAVQMDRHLQQAADVQRVVTCGTAMQQAQAWMEVEGQSGPGRVSVGEETYLTIKAHLPEGSGMRVTDCVAHDGAGEASQRLLDDWGCPLDELILPAMHLHNSTGLQEAVTTFPAFKFPDRSSLHMRCSIQLCRGPCPKVECGTNGRSSFRNSRKLKEEVVDQLEVFNSVEVAAPGIELDSLLSPDMPLPPAQVDRAFCLSPPKMALAFGVLGLVFLVAVAVALCTLLRGRRHLDEETLIVQDSPLHVRVMR